jgi:phospholipid/cholesterol/gamma-HCH transport system permease protein
LANHTDAEAPQEQQPPRWTVWVDNFYRPFTHALESLGAYFYFTGQFFGWLVRPPYRISNTIDQMEFVGVGSLPIVLLVAFFTGAVFSLQTVDAARIYHGEVYVGMAVAVMLAREIAPVFAAIMVTARVGSGMATELGSMRITEQIDALFTLGADPVRYLVVPRTAAAVLMLPCLTLFGDMIGIAAGLFYNVVLMGVNGTVYLRNTLLYLELWDVLSGLFKAAVFGGLIALIGCSHGLRTEGGAEGVGRATTRAVVFQSISILVVNFFLSELLPGSLSR